VNALVFGADPPLLASSEISNDVKVTASPTLIVPSPQRSTILSVKV
jgi:hypothetical protein